MTRRTPRLFLAAAAASGFAAFASSAGLLGHTAPPVAADDLPFAAVQPELFAVPNSFSNAWGDYDNDGDLDLAVSLGSGEVRLYRNDAGTLVSVGAQLGMPQAGSHELRGLSWGDYDGDGFIDLLGGSTPTDKLTVVLHNEGGKKFVDVAAAIGLTIPGRSARQTNWVDYDNDGDLDVYSSRSARRQQAVSQRRRHASRTSSSASAPPIRGRPSAPAGSTWTTTAISISSSPTSPAPPTPCGATTAPRSWTSPPQLGMTGPSRTKDEGGVGCAIGDYDNDGNLDIFVPNYGHNQLYRNNGNGTFTDVAAKVGLAVENHAVGSDWGDYDNDGDLDLSIISYVGAPGQQQPMNALFRNDGAKGFTNLLTKDSPLNRGDHAVADGGLRQRRRPRSVAHRRLRT